MNQSPVVEVAVGIIHRADGCVLLGKRPPGSFYPGYWEFPGGKIEIGEQAHQALCREISEELNIRILRPQPWLVREHKYEHAQVRLHFFRVNNWQGRIHARIHSELYWLPTDSNAPLPMLEANGSILQALRLPTQIGITNTAHYGIENQLDRIQQALQKGLRRIHVREPTLPPNALHAFSLETIRLAQQHGAHVILHARPQDESLVEAYARVRSVCAHGLHLPACWLHTLETIGHKTADCAHTSYSASCHNRAELLHAARLQVDYAFLSPIAATATHPQAAALGWGGFAALSAHLPLPIYALGGLSAADLAAAQRAGAHGIAAIRAAWAESL